MDYMKRLEELGAKEKLTEAEQTEAKLIYSMALLALRDLRK